MLRDAVALVCFLDAPRRELAFAWVLGPRAFELRAVVPERDDGLDAFGFLACAPDDFAAAGFLACAPDDFAAAGFLACAPDDLAAAGFLACAPEDDLARWLLGRWVDALRGARFSLRDP